jgi:hypothetical protein
VDDGTCEVSRLLATESLGWLKVKILTETVEHCQSLNVVWVWLDMYRDCGGYILTGVREVWSKKMDRCPLTGGSHGC